METTQAKQDEISFFSLLKAKRCDIFADHFYEEIFNFLKLSFRKQNCTRCWLQVWSVGSKNGKKRNVVVGVDISKTLINSARLGSCRKRKFYACLM